MLISRIKKAFLDTWIGHLMFDKTGSLLISILLSCFILYTAPEVFQGDDKSDVVTVIITIITITVGFATAALTMFLGITDKPVIERIRKRGYIKSLIYSFKDLIYFGGLVILLSIIVSIYGQINYVILNTGIELKQVLIFLFVLCTCASLMYALSLVQLILLIFNQLLIEPNIKKHSQ